MKIYSDKNGRIVEHEGYAVSIHWSASMLDYLRRHFPTTLNDELAGCLCVSKRTLIRKARELGLAKDEAWLHGIWEERRQLARAVSKQKGFPGGFKKGVRSNPSGEFKKGHGESEEVKAKRIASVKRWCRLNPEKVMARALKVAKKRKENREKNK